MHASFFTLDELGLRSNADPRPAGVRAKSGDANDAPTVFEINDLATLAELQPLWRHLAAQTPWPAFAQTFEWLQLYWSHFGDRQRLRAFCVERDGDTTGLTILTERQVHGRHELALPSVGPETLGPLGNDGFWSWRAIAGHLCAELSRKHVLDLRGLCDPQDRTLAAFKAVGLPVRRQIRRDANVMRLEKEFEMLWSRVLPALRNQVELGEQRLTTLGSTNFVRFRPLATEIAHPQFPNELYPDLLSVALNDEAQLARPDSILNAPERHAFLRDLLPWAWQHAAADLCLLLIGSRPVAFRFHTLARGHLRTVWTGVDAEFRQLPLAALLLYRTLRDSVQRGDVELELAPTEAEAARDWNALQRPLQRIVAGACSRSDTTQDFDEVSLHVH